MKKKYLFIITSSVFIVILACISIYIYASIKCNRMPAKNVEWFLTRGKTSNSEKVVVCIGDSRTHGNESVNYVSILENRLDKKGYIIINAGIRGILSSNITAQLDRIIKCQPDYITILIGTNDAILSESEMDNSNNTIVYFFKKFQHKIYRANLNLSQKPSPYLFKKNLIRIVVTLTNKTSAKIALLSIPIIGEDIKNNSHKIAYLFSKLINTTAQEMRITYLPLFEHMTDYLKKYAVRKPIPYNDDYLILYILAMIRHHIFGTSLDVISHERGFYLLVDQQHLNSTGAQIVADLIETFIITQAKDKVC